MPITRPLLAILLAFCLAPGLAAQEYLVRSGDTLRIEVVEDPEMNRNVLVMPDGRVHLPFAGDIVAGGRSVDQIRQGVAAALADDFVVVPTVFVSLAALAPPAVERPAPAPVPEVVEMLSVYVMGEVAKPGRIEVRPGTTVLQVFATVGGFSEFAATKRIQLRRTDGAGEVAYAVDYDAIERGQSANGQVAVADGDTLIVPTRRLFE